MPNHHLQRVQKPRRKETTKIPKGPFSYLASYLTKSNRIPPHQSSKLRTLKLTDNSGVESKHVHQSRIPTEEIIGFKNESQVVDSSTAVAASTSKPKTHTPNPTTLQTKCTLAFKGSQKSQELETKMHHNTPSQSIESQLPNTTKEVENDTRGINTTATAIEKHKRDVQDMFIKSLISKLTKERREAKLRLTSSRRSRYLIAVKRIVRKGWSTRPTAEIKDVLGGEEGKLNE